MPLSEDDRRVLMWLVALQFFGLNQNSKFTKNELDAIRRSVLLNVNWRSSLTAMSGNEPYRAFITFIEGSYQLLLPFATDTIPIEGELGLDRASKIRELLKLHDDRIRYLASLFPKNFDFRV